MSKINIDKLLLQNALSGELHIRLTRWRELKEEITELANQYEQMAEAEDFLRDDCNMKKIESDFFKKQAAFHFKSELLRAIFTHPVYVN